MVFKNENVEVTVDSYTGAVVIKHFTGAKVEILGNNVVGLKVTSNDDVKLINSTNFACLITSN